MISHVKCDLSALPNHVLVHNMEKGDKVTKGGIIVLDDNGKDRGIKARWCQVYRVGANIDYLKEGEWILVSHGRWTWGVDVTDSSGNTSRVQRVDTKDILGATDQNPL